MQEGDRPRTLEILAAWNMAPQPPSGAIPEPERKTLNIATTYVAELGGRIVGVASYILHNDREAETASLAIDPALRGSGVGEKLQHARLAEMKRRGVRLVRTEADRPWVIEWYRRKFGYTVRGTKRKLHAFSERHIDSWTVLELDLRSYEPPAE
jgi:ribosomal protein S18 acetylase RimI-like enzyme